MLFLHPLFHHGIHCRSPYPHIPCLSILCISVSHSLYFCFSKSVSISFRLSIHCRSPYPHIPCVSISFSLSIYLSLSSSHALSFMLLCTSVSHSLYFCFSKSVRISFRFFLSIFLFLFSCSFSIFFNFSLIKQITLYEIS